MDAHQLTVLTDGSKVAGMAEAFDLQREMDDAMARLQAKRALSLEQGHSSWKIPKSFQLSKHIYTPRK